MDTIWRGILWQQFGASIDMLENAVKACPEPIWSDRSQRPKFWYVVYHALFFLDLYLSPAVEGFRPPAPFTLAEIDPAGVLPERPYTRDELRGYLEHCRQKCRGVIGALADERVRERFRWEWMDFSIAELLLYNMRHVQHHTAQLNLILRQRTDSAPGWVSRARGAGLGE